MSETLASARVSGSTGGSLSLWLDPGVYFVLINYLFDNTEYTLGLSSVSRPDSAGETNNTLLRAVDLGAAATLRTVSDFVGLPDTQDWYRFQVQESVRLVNVGVSRVTGTMDFYVLRDLDSDGVSETLASARVSGSTGGSLSLWLDPGVYFVLINYLFDNTEYTLGLSSVSRPDSAGEPNNTLLRAVDLGAATTLRTVSDFVGLPETQDWYRFQIQGTVRSVNVGVSDMTGTVDVYILRDANNDGVPETVASARVSGATGGSLKRELG